MLAYPVVLAAARHARAIGLEVGIVSNCFWAESLDDALVWLAPFAELGLADLALSSYAYFTERLEDETRLRNALLAARRLGLPGAVLEVGAAAALADIGVPCGEPGQIMYKGRAARDARPWRAPRAARRPSSSRAPTRTSPTPAAATWEPTAT